MSEAERLANEFERAWSDVEPCVQAAAELRRLSAELEDARTEATALRVTEENLRAELEAENGAFGKRQDWWNNRMVELEQDNESLRSQNTELDKKLAELEQRNRDLYEDVQRFKEHALNEKDARVLLERQLAEARQALEGWANYDTWVWPASALEQAKKNTLSALAAMKKEQT